MHWLTMHMLTTHVPVDYTTGQHSPHTPHTQLRRDGHETKGVADETVFATVYEKPEYLPPSGPFGHAWDSNVHFVSSHDFFNSQHDKVVACGNMFEIISHKVFLALPSKCPTGPDGKPRNVPSVWCWCFCNVLWCFVVFCMMGALLLCMQHVLV